MNRHEVLKKYRKKLIKADIGIAAVITIFEILVYFMMEKQAMRSLFYDHYFLAYTLFPTSINIVTITVMILIERAKKISERVKNASSVYGLFVMALNVSCVHSYFLSVSCCLMLPILVSCLYADKQLMRGGAVAAFISLAISTAVSNFEQNDMSAVMLNSTVIFIMILIAYMLGNVMINFTEENVKEIQQRILRENVLELRLKRDQMTGLYNQGIFYEQLDKDVETAALNKSKLILAIIDIDDFKRVNDMYGHESGDIVLKKLARVMIGHCDINDTVCRYGGEEFAIIFKNKSKNRAKEIMEIILTEFRNVKFSFTDDRITFSCGICEYNGGSSQDLFRRSDSAMYDAKKQGKNRIVVK